MKTSSSITSGTTGSLLSTLVLFLVSAPAVHATPLDEYVKKADPVYSYSVEKVIEDKEKDCTTFIIHLVSQTWRSSSEVNQPVWNHWLTVVRPKQLASHKALLYVGGGKSTDEAPQKADSKWLEIAKNTKSIVAELKNVPNQPLMYFKDGQPRNEDNSVGYSWVKAMETNDPTWSIRLPMVKSVVRAMDSIDDLMKSPRGGKINIDGYVVSGASKRGWTTWLSAAVDKRVIAIVPMVIDVLNVQKIVQHHYSAYGFWSSALRDYVHHNIAEKFQTKEFSKLMSFEDPYHYRDRITVPKYIINASGDQFFLPDSSQFYFNDLLGEKYLRYIPNSDHSMAETDAYQNLEVYYHSIISNSPRSKFSWSKKGDGSIEVKTVDKPSSVILWSAVNPNARDFRVETIGKSFVSTPLHSEKDGTYIGKVDLPKSGYIAYFIELSFHKEGESLPLKFTTDVTILPESLPFKEKYLNLNN